MHPYGQHRAHKVEKSRVGHIAKGYADGGAVSENDADDQPQTGRGNVMLYQRSQAGTMKNIQQNRMDGGKVKHRADKRARGGKVKYDDASEPKGMKGTKAQMPEPPEMRARGGRLKGKGKTTVNVVVGAHPHPAAPMAGPPMAPPMAAPAAPPMARPPMAGPPMMPPPGAMPPGGPIRSTGGRAYAKGGSVKSGPAWDEGVRHGTKPVNDPGKNDMKDIGRGKPITYNKGGAVEGRRLVSFYAKGGKVESPQGVAEATKLPGGSGGGEARLAKEERAERKYKKAS